MKCENCKFYGKVCDPVSGKSPKFKPKDDDKERFNRTLMSLLLLLLAFPANNTEKDLTRKLTDLMEDKTDEEEKG